MGWGVAGAANGPNPMENDSEPKAWGTSFHSSGILPGPMECKSLASPALPSFRISGEASPS